MGIQDSVLDVDLGLSEHEHVLLVVLVLVKWSVERAEKKVRMVADLTAQMLGKGLTVCVS